MSEIIVHENVRYRRKDAIRMGIIPAEDTTVEPVASPDSEPVSEAVQTPAEASGTGREPQGAADAEIAATDPAEPVSEADPAGETDVEEKSTDEEAATKVVDPEVTKEREPETTKRRGRASTAQ